MYLTHMEHSLIKNSYNNNDYTMSEIVFAHYNFKKDYLLQKKDRMIISVFRYHMLSKKADKQFLECIQSMENLMHTRREFFKESLNKFEKSIYDLDVIGVNISQNPMDIILNHRRRR